MSDITFDCPHCQNHVVFDERGSGMEVPCPHCSQVLRIPAPPATPPSLPTVHPLKTVNPKLVALAEKYRTMDHPMGPMDAMLARMGGQSVKKPTYKVSAQGTIQRVSESLGGMGSTVDMKIVQVASCLKSLGNLNMFDAQSISKAAMVAIEHYAALPKVRKFFLLPYEARVGGAGNTANVPVDEQCRVLAGVENLLLEIYEELPSDGSTITDELVETKIGQFMQSA